MIISTIVIIIIIISIIIIIEVSHINHFIFYRSFGPYEIMAKYKTALHGNEPQLAYLWKFDEITGQTDEIQMEIYFI